MLRGSLPKSLWARTLLFASAGLLCAASWAGYELFRNPHVELGAPKLVKRTGATPGQVTLILGGDFAPTDAALPLIAEHGYEYPFRATASLFQEADIAFANLEAPITEIDKPHHRFNKYKYRVDPKALSALTWLGLDIVSVANNHSFDHGPRGLLDTVKHLGAHGIEPVGAGDTEARARRPVIFDVSGIKIGFVAYLENQTHYNLYARTFAIDGRTGCAQWNRADVAEDIRRLRALSDFVIVSTHWGKNYLPITESQQELGAFMIDEGADLVVGHHPHIAQALERRNGRFIIYSLGNYAWGAPGRSELRFGLLSRVRVEKQGSGRARVSSIEVLPIVTQNRIVQYQPRRLTENELDWLTPLLEESARRGAHFDVKREQGNVLLVAAMNK